MKSLLTQLRREDEEAIEACEEQLKRMEKERDRKLDDLDREVRTSTYCISLTLLQCYKRFIEQ